jgi:hypothetical protein
LQRAYCEKLIFPDLETNINQSKIKNMSKIKNISAQEILDSRGNPTVMVNLALDNNITTSACVPSARPPASVKPLNSATATPNVTAARACSGRSRTSTKSSRRNSKASHRKRKRK